MSRWLLPALVTALCLASPAAAQQSPFFSGPALDGFRSVLAQGEGQQVNLLEFAAFTATGTPPATYTNQQPLYVDVMAKAATLQAPDLDRFYKSTKFGEMPGGVGRRYSPRQGVTVYRDARFGMAHIYGDTRSDLMFGAGYATAEERLFAMDALRNTAKGTLARITGPGGASMDRSQHTDQNFTDEELRRQFDELPARFGPMGARGRQDVLAYIAGINARIDDVRADPTILPAEYVALNVTPQRWDVSDTVAMAVLLVTQFTVSNGGEERNAQIRMEFQKRFGKRWRGVFEDFRKADDPETYTVSRARHVSDRPGRRRRGVNLLPDLGSIKPYNPQTTGPGAAAAGTTAPWVDVVSRIRSAIPDHASNAVLVGSRYSKSGRPLWAAGPQVSYFSPQIFVEQELHGGGIDVTGVTFPGASPWPLIGHGIDFAWSGTSANGDNQDTFVETLCNPDGSPATAKSRHYRYRGRCIPFLERDVRLTTPPPGLGNSSPQTAIAYRPLRSVHGPVFAFATVGGKPVALTKAKGVNFRELDGVLPFMSLAENVPTDYRSFIKTLSVFPGTENWIYVDSREVGFLQSGRYPAHAKGADVDLPYNGDGTGDWQRFDPTDYSFRTISPARRPRAVGSRQPIIITWNQKEAPGWRKGPTEWSNGSVHHAETLHDHLVREIRAGGGKTDLTGLTRAVNRAATTDVRGQEVYPQIRRVIGRASGDQERLLALLDAWSAAGSQRLDDNGDNVYEHSAAVALFDRWWPRLVRAQFEPVLGKELFDKVESGFLGLGSTVADDWGWSWSSVVEKDLRMVLGRRPRGPHSRLYCGGTRTRGAVARCRAILLETLGAAVEDARRAFGSEDTSTWKVRATCEDTSPPSCDQNVPTTLGAVDTPAFPWQNRGTYHQVVELTGRR